MGSSLPLAGARVADLTWMIAGPYGTFLLARMGAEVIKIEGLEPLDHTRENPPHADMIPGPNRSGFFNSLNAGKKSVTLQLRNAEQLQLAKEIIATSDVFIESFSYGTVDKLGLGYEEVRRLRPNIIMVSCSGFGQTRRDRRPPASWPPPPAAPPSSSPLSPPCTTGSAPAAASASTYRWLTWSSR